MPKGDHLAGFELLVLLAIEHVRPTAYGVSIRQEMERRTGRSVSIGAVYATLGRLVDKGFVAIELSEPEPVPGGRARKLARLTPTGRAALVRATTQLVRMFEGLPPSLVPRLRP